MRRFSCAGAPSPEWFTERRDGTPARCAERNDAAESLAVCVMAGIWLGFCLF
jgi:hypothetical protein